MKSISKDFDLKRFVSHNIRELTLFAILIVIAVLVQVRTGGRFLSSSNLNDLLRETAILMMVSVGMMMVILTGCIDLSLGSTMGLAGMICALTLRDHRETPIIVIVLIALGIGLLAGLLHGFIVAKLRIFPLIGTLGVCDMLRGLVYVFSKGAWVGQGDMTQEFMSISTGKVFGINNLVFIAILITVMGYIFLQYFRNGRYMYAVGNNELSAKISGINPVRTKFLAYVINGMIAGLAGMLWICKFGNAQGESCSSYELNVIASVVLGGVFITGGSGKVGGVVLGVLLFGTLNNILPLIQVSSFWQMGIKGFVIIASVVINSITQQHMDKKALQGRD